MKILLLTVTVAALVAVSSALAAPSATLSVTPSAPLLGDSVVFTGCGWTQTNQNGIRNLVVLDIYSPDGIGFAQAKVPASKSGCFTTSGAFPPPIIGEPGTDFQATETGTYHIAAAQGGAGKTHQAYLDFAVG